MVPNMSFCVSTRGICLGFPCHQWSSDVKSSQYRLKNCSDTLCLGPTWSFTPLMRIWSHSFGNRLVLIIPNEIISFRCLAICNFPEHLGIQRKKHFKFWSQSKVEKYHWNIRIISKASTKMPGCFASWVICGLHLFLLAKWLWDLRDTSPDSFNTASVGLLRVRPGGFGSTWLICG